MYRAMSMSCHVVTMSCHARKFGDAVSKHMFFWSFQRSFLSDRVGNECGEVNFRSCGTKFGWVHCVVVLQGNAIPRGVTRYQSKVRGGSVGVKMTHFVQYHSQKTTETHD